MDVATLTGRLYISLTLFPGLKPGATMILSLRDAREERKRKEEGLIQYGLANKIFYSLHSYPMKKFISCLLFLIPCVIGADTLTVTSLNDSGSGTLREAISIAMPGDTIIFDGALSGTLSLSSALPSVAVDYLTITAPVSNLVTIDGGSLYRIFDVQSSPFTVSNINLSNGAHVNQGGIVHINPEHYVTIQRVNITPSNSSINPLYVEQDGELNLIDVDFLTANASHIYLNGGSMNVTSNIAMNLIVDGVGGGQLYTSGTSTLNLSTPVSTTSDYFLEVGNDTVVFSGSLSDSCVVLPGSMLEGDFNMAYIASLGVVLPGTASSFGIMSLGGDYISAHANTDIKIDPSGTVDMIQVGGDVMLTSGSTLNVLPQSGTYTTGQKFVFLTTSGGITGTFTTVTSGSLVVQINYFAQSIEIEILVGATI